MKRVFNYFLRFFLHGIAIIAPVLLTVYTLYLVFDFINQLIPGLPRLFPGFGFIAAITFILFIGYFGSKFLIGKWIIDGLDQLLKQIPGIQFIYTTFKDIINPFMGDKKKLNNPVWVKVQDSPEQWRIGFLTQKNMDVYDLPDQVAVYLPHSYAISGWVIVVHPNAIKPVKGMNAAEAMKFAVSGGIAMNETK